VKSLAVLVLLIANAMLALFVTYPRFREDVFLSRRTLELESKHAEHARGAERWTGASDSVVRSQAALERTFGDGRAAVPRLRLALLELEKGLELERTSATYHFEGMRDGLRRYKIGVRMRGEFESLYTYLERASLLKAPLAPSDLTLTPDAAGDGTLNLDVAWTAAWPEASAPEGRAKRGR